jgi:hypothetical protein
MFCEGKIVAKIRGLLINDALSLRFPAFIMRALVVKSAVQTAVQIAVAVRAGIGAPYPVARFDWFFAAMAVRHSEHLPYAACKIVFVISTNYAINP